jgi:ABC-2 type transport system permease protein
MVAARDFHERVRTRGFWIGILVLPGILVLSMLLPGWLRGMRDVRSFAVVDRSGWLADAVAARALREDLTLLLTTAAARTRNAVAAEEPAIMRGLATIARSRDAMNMDGVPAAAREQLVISALAARAAGIATAERTAVESALADQPGFAEEFVQQASALREWWLGLDARFARRFGDRIARGRFVERNADESSTADLNRRVGAGELFAYVVVPADPLAPGASVRYVSRNITDESLREWFMRMAGEEIRERRLSARGIDANVARAIQQRVPVVLTRLDEQGNETGVADEDFLREFAPAGFTYIMWIAVFTISQGLLLSTIEEKSTRVIEVLLSSVSPRQLMAGKILGAMSVGLTTVLTWAALFAGVALVLPGVLDRGLGPLELDLMSVIADPRYLLSFVCYFLLAYLLFATLLVGIGSLCNTVQESQTLMAPVTALMVIPMLGMISLADDPDSMVARVMSYIPPFTPFAMMGRAAVPPPLLDYVVTTILLLLSIYAVFVAAVRVFSVGILMTGKPPSWSEIVKWLRTT